MTKPDRIIVGIDCPEPCFVRKVRLGNRLNVWGDELLLVLPHPKPREAHDTFAATDRGLSASVFMQVCVADFNGHAALFGD